MKWLSIYSLTIVVTGMATAMFAPVALHRSQIDPGNVNQTEAAFRDGLFLARLDFKNDRKPHLMTGRWRTDADRRMFVAAYLQTYRAMRGTSAPEQLEPSHSAAWRGYRDGLTDGMQQHYESGSFRPSATENYKRADRGYSGGGGDLNQYRQAYREGYCNGYQMAFYGEPREIQLATALEGSAPD